MDPNAKPKQIAVNTEQKQKDQCRSRGEGRGGGSTKWAVETATSNLKL